jgi:hypothetical protein
VNVLGSIRIKAEDGESTASLVAGQPPWRCDDNDLAMALNLLFPIRNYSPSHGQYGAQQFHDAVAWLKKQGWEVTARLKPDLPSPPGTIF